MDQFTQNKEHWVSNYRNQWIKKWEKFELDFRALSSAENPTWSHWRSNHLNFLYGQLYKHLNWKNHIKEDTIILKLNRRENNFEGRSFEEQASHLHVITFICERSILESLFCVVDLRKRFIKINENPYLHTFSKR